MSSENPSSAPQTTEANADSAKPRLSRNAKIGAAAAAAGIGSAAIAAAVLYVSRSRKATKTPTVPDGSATD